MNRTSSPDPGALLTEQEAAELLNVSVRTLQDWRVTSDGPPFARVGRLVRYRRDSLHAWLAQNTVQPRTRAV